MTNDRYANPATNVCGQSSIIGSSVADGSSLCIHYAQFNNLAVGTHSLEISYGGDSGKSVGNFYGLNVYQTKVYQEPCVTITSAENVGDAFEYTLDVPESVIENDYNYFIALKDRDGILCEAKYKEPQGKFENVDGKDYTLVVYTWTKQMEPIGMDTMIGYTKLDISADKDIDISPDLLVCFMRI